LTENIGGIYVIRNTLNGHLYVGSAVNLAQRKRVHWARLRHQEHHSAHLQAAFNKYGEDAFQFEPLILCDKEELIGFEQELMDRLHPEYNIDPIAGSPLGRRASAETRIKMSISHKGIKHTTLAKAKISLAHKGRKYSPETLAKMSAAKLGKKRGPLSVETRNKISVANTGKKRTPEMILNNSIAHIGKKLTPETRAKLSAINIGKTLSAEHKAKISMAHKKRHEAGGSVA